MKIVASLFLYLCCLINPVCAQQYFEFPKVSQSADNPFDKVVVLDKRTEKETVARLKLDAATGYILLNAKPDLSIALAEYCLKTLNKADNSEKELVIVVHRFFVGEIDSINREEKEFGCFRFTADFFVKEAENQYRLIGFSDQEQCVSAYNVTDELIRTTGKTIVAAYDVVRKQPAPSDQVYSLEYLQTYNMETIKGSLPFSGTLPDTAYFDHWNDFLAMRSRPDMEVRMSKSNVSFYRINKKQKRSKLYTLPGQIFIANGKVYYGLRSAYWEMERVNGTFRFKAPVYIRKEKIGMRSGYILTLGLIGASIMAQQKDYVLEYYECEVDNRTGELIPLKKLYRLEDCSPHLSLY